MRSSLFNSPLKLSAVLLAAIFTTACSNYHYKDYQGEWAPESMTPYDLSNNAPDAALVYFATTQFRAIGVPFHRLLLATQVDDQPLPGAGVRQFSTFPVNRRYALRPESTPWAGAGYR